MNKRILLGLSILSISSAAYSWNEKSAVLTKETFLSVKTHTELHTVTLAHNMALIKASGLAVDGKCESGVFFNSSSDPEAYSLALAAYASKTSIRITYDVDQVAPWGSTNYCALTGIEFSN